MTNNCYEMTRTEIAQLPFELHVEAPGYGDATLVKNVAETTYEINDASGKYFGEIPLAAVAAINRIGDLGILVADAIDEFIREETPEYSFADAESDIPLLCNRAEYCLYKITRDTLRHSPISPASDQAIEMSGLSREKYIDCMERTAEYEKVFE